MLSMTVPYPHAGIRPNSSGFKSWDGIESGRGMNFPGSQDVSDAAVH